MTKEFEDRGTTYSIHENVNIGEVKVADEVVAIIAGLAATVEESSVLVDITLNLKYGTQIPAVSAKVQDKVKSSIETMTGLSVTEVNIKVASVNVEN